MSYFDFAGAADNVDGCSLNLQESQEVERGVAQGPERALMSAVLFDGVLACINYAAAQTRSARIRFREAYNWIMTRGDDYVFSFDNVCQCLGLAPEALRVGIERCCVVRHERSRKARRTCF